MPAPLCVIILCNCLLTWGDNWQILSSFVSNEHIQPSCPFIAVLVDSSVGTLRVHIPIVSRYDNNVLNWRNRQPVPRHIAEIDILSPSPFIQVLAVLGVANRNGDVFDQSSHHLQASDCSGGVFCQIVTEVHIFSQGTLV